MKKKLFVLLLLAAFLQGFIQQPSSTKAAEEMYPKITSVQPINFVLLSK